MKLKISPRSRTLLALAAAATLAACASAPAVNPAVETARAAYQRAAADPTVVRSAEIELGQAREALQRADAALRAGEDRAAIEHQAYLARQRVEVAEQAGRIAEADRAVAASQAERDRILIDARGREAEAQRARAEQERAAAMNARGQAEKSLADAEAARLQAEKAKREADAARAQAEQARADAERAGKLAQEQQAAAEAARQAAEAAQARAGSLESQLAELKARNTERGMVLTLGDVLFDTGLASLKPGAMRTVDQLAMFMDKNPERRILVEGHTDSQGSDAFNRSLSQRRAQAVRDALTARRIDAARIDIAGLGEDYPVANNQTPAGRQQNRRVEIVISDASGAVAARKP